VKQVEVTAVVESNRSLGEVSGYCGKSLIVTDSHWVLKQSTVGMESHCLLYETRSRQSVHDSVVCASERKTEIFESDTITDSDILF
jgi:hypothetical protein